MTAAAGLCPVKGCTKTPKPNQLMCWPHWRRVPKSLNHAVFDTYRNLRSDPAAYRQARSAAIEAVETKEATERGEVCPNCDGDKRPDDDNCSMCANVLAGREP